MTRLTGATRGAQRMLDRRQQQPGSLGSRAIFFLRSGIAIKRGTGVAGLGASGTGVSVGGARAVVYSKAGHGVVGTVGSGARPASAVTLLPTAQLEIAFQSQPLAASPTWTDVSARLRHVGGLGSTRGRSYEFDRMETGTLRATLNNRDAALSPENTASPYAPVRSTRPIRARFAYGNVYAAFRGISEGYPQSYTSLGLDAVVSLQANDLFYALNNSRFTPGSTFLLSAITTAPATTTTEQITVGSTNPPMPQVVPFDIQVEDEQMTVTAIVDQFTYEVERGGTTAATHLATSVKWGGATPVTTEVVNFAEAYSGIRIQQALEAAGFGASWYDLDTGQSLIAGSEDLATASPLEHINLIAEAEFGRFFVARDGRFTFRDRASLILNYLTPVLTFRDGANTAAGEVPYRLEQPLEHSDEKLYNRVKITTDSGYAVDVKDQASIDEHFERVFEKTYPYAEDPEADAAAQFVLETSATDTLRLPQIVVQGANDPARLWPLLLAREIGERVRFRYQPVGGGTEIVKDMVIEGIGHERTADNHRVFFQCTEITAQQFWILGLASYGELDTATRLAF